MSAEDSMTAIDKEVTGVNKEQLEMKEIETKEMLLKDKNWFWISWVVERKSKNQQQK